MKWVWGKTGLAERGIYIVAYGIAKREQRRSFQIERASTGFIVPLMEGTLTWLFIIEVGTLRPRNNASLLHVHRSSAGETNENISFALCVYADYGIDVITRQLSSIAELILYIIRIFPSRVLQYTLIAAVATWSHSCESKTLRPHSRGRVRPP